MRSFLKTGGRRCSAGLGAVEVLVGTAIVTAALLGAVTVYDRFTIQALRSVREVQAGFLLGEGIEALRSLRDNGWASSIVPLTVGTSYQLSFSGSLWQATTTPMAFIDGAFERTVVLASTTRDGNDDIAPSGTEDPNTREVTVTLSWRAQNATTTRQLSTYLSNLFGT